MARALSIGGSVTGGQFANSLRSHANYLLSHQALRQAEAAAATAAAAAAAAAATATATSQHQAAAARQPPALSGHVMTL